jgi:hypothetical protein
LSGVNERVTAAVTRPVAFAVTVRPVAYAVWALVVSAVLAPVTKNAPAVAGAVSTVGVIDIAADDVSAMNEIVVLRV